ALNQGLAAEPRHSSPSGPSICISTLTPPSKGQVRHTVQCRGMVSPKLGLAHLQHLYLECLEPHQACLVPSMSYNVAATVVRCKVQHAESDFRHCAPLRR